MTSRETKLMKPEAQLSTDDMRAFYLKFPLHPRGPQCRKPESPNVR
jgi:hypothetical protein